MGKMMNKFLNMMKLNDDYDDYDDDYYDDEEDNIKPLKKAAARKESYLDDEEEEPVSPKPARMKTTKSAKVVPMRTANTRGEVCVIRPSNVEDGREISDTLLSGRAVVLNLEGLQVSIAQRIIDFTSGACYSINGNLQKISNYIFIITPESVDISGDFQDLLNGTAGFDVAGFHTDQL